MGKTGGRRAQQVVRALKLRIPAAELRQFSGFCRRQPRTLDQVSSDLSNPAAQALRRVARLLRHRLHRSPL